MYVSGRLMRWPRSLRIPLFIFSQDIESASSSVLTFLDIVVDEGLSSNGDPEINLSILADLRNHLLTFHLTTLT